MKKMRTSQEGLDLIMKHEGMRNHPYLCPAGVPTIGYGTTFYPDGTKVTLQDKPVTRFEAIQLLKENLRKFEDGVGRLVENPLKQNQFDALVSFAYNVGIGNFERSTLLKRINEDPDHEDITNQFKRWDKARVDGVLTSLKGLRKRRNQEAWLYTAHTR